MKVVRNSIVALTALSCLGALAISVHPGLLNELLFVALVLSCLVSPIAVIFLVIAMKRLSERGRLGELRAQWRAGLLVLALLFVTYGLLKFYVPRRVGFALSRASFEPLVQQAVQSEYRGKPLNLRLGLYNVDEYAADPRGGVYFRVHTHGDGIDIMSYGFAYKPNPNGSPFGASGYRIHPLGNGWF